MQPILSAATPTSPHEETISIYAYMYAFAAQSKANGGGGVVRDERLYRGVD